MRNREDLFHLVRSMSKSEKRYFVLDAKKSGRRASRYLALFDHLNNLEEYDEAPLKKKFPKNLSSDKAYLYEAILRSMRDYRSSSSRAAQVKERLIDARYLHERGLYTQSNERILEAKAIARELEDPFSLLEILREEQLSLYDRRVKVEIEKVSELQREESSALSLIAEEIAYIDLYFLLLTEVFKGVRLKEEDLAAALKEHLPIHRLEEGKIPSSPRARRRQFLCNAVYAVLRGDLDRQYESYYCAVEWWNDYPAIKQEEFHRFISDVGNLVYTCYKRPEWFPVAEEWINRLQNEEAPDNYHDQRWVFTTLSVSRLLHLLNQHEFKKAHQMLPEIVEGVNRFGLKKSIHILANITITNFLADDYQGCIEWVSQVKRQMKTGTRDDVYRLLRLLGLIALYEEGELDRLDGEIRSVYRYFKRTSLAKSSFEYTVLDHYLREIFHAPIGELKAAYRQFIEYLGSVDEAEKVKPLGLDELLIWAKKKH